MDGVSSSPAYSSRPVCQTDSLQIDVRVKPFRDRLPESRHEILPVTAGADIVADKSGLGLVPHDHVMRTRVQRRSGKRGARFLVLKLTVDDRSDSSPSIELDILPYVENRATGRIDNDTTFFRQDV